MERLIIICGPTGTGKTKLALHLSKVIKGEIVSADSRQLYKGLTIGTGKEYSFDTDVTIWGYDIVGPKDSISVAQFEQYALQKITGIRAWGKVPLLVGGTGLYIKAVVDGIPTAIVPQDMTLRSSLINKTADELFSMLSEINLEYAQSLNKSDKNNPRRLIRAIEIAQSGVSRETGSSRFDTLFIGLTAPKEVLYKRIEESVRRRVAEGVVIEIKTLLSQGVTWSDQSMTSLGYRQWREFFEGTKTEGEVIKEWIHEEQLYVKRQLTWFKKDHRIQWFDIQDESYPQKVLQLCQEFIDYAEKN